LFYLLLKGVLKSKYFNPQEKTEREREREKKKERKKVRKKEIADDKKSRANCWVEIN
jgi:hypothetical protein